MPKIKELALEVFRGLQLTKMERLKINAEEGNVSEAVILNYDNISSYTENLLLKDTIDFTCYDNANKVYVDLNKKFKNVLIRPNDIVIPVKMKQHQARFVSFRNTKSIKKMIYSNDLLVVRPDETKISARFLFLMLSTKHVQERLDKHVQERLKKQSGNSKDNPHRITVEMINELEVELPSRDEQEKILRQLEKINYKKAQLEKGFENLIK